MKRALLTMVACGLGASLAYATGGIANLPVLVSNTLSAIDTVPTKDQLKYAFGTDALALTNLSSISKDANVDVGVRVRAIHALAKYCDPCGQGEVAHDSLSQLITDTKNEIIGEPLVLLRAAIETLGTLHVATDWSTLASLLDHPSRDIRAAAARALRDLCNTQGIVPLRVRYATEPTEQVKLAISEALRILDQCGQ